MWLLQDSTQWTLSWRGSNWNTCKGPYALRSAMRTIPTKVLEMLLDLQTLGMAVESAALMATYCLQRPDLRNQVIGHNRIGAKADKVDSKFRMIKDHITQQRTFSKYRIVIPTVEE